MQPNIPEAEIYETGKNNLKNPTIFVGFVGAGLVGTIAVDHMINELDMKEVGFYAQNIYRHQQYSCKVD